MRIVFDPSFDSGYWPGPLAERDASAGESWVGRAGLLSALETCLGLGAPHLSSAERAAHLVPNVRTHDGFWSKSAEVDALGAARRLLHIRDELWLGGWRGQPLTERLAQLSAVTESALPGMPDRLLAIEQSVRTRKADIAHIEILKPDDDLPRLWRTILDNLESRGTELTSRVVTEQSASGDLQAARSKRFSPKGDGTLQLLRPYGDLDAAEEVAAWLSVHPASGRILVIGSDPVLDAALHRHGLPTTGAPLSRGDNALLELIPLVLAMGWSPADPEQALSLLTLPASPVPPSIARRLRRALSEWPAAGSPAWTKALAEGLDRIPEPDRRTEVQERITALFTPTAPRGKPYPIPEIAKRLDNLMSWLRVQVAVREKNAPTEFDSGPWHIATSACERLQSLAKSTGLDGLRIEELERFTGQVLDEAGAYRAHAAQVGIASVEDAGSVAGPADTTIWWNFRGDMVPRVSKLALFPEERHALAEAGVSLRDPKAIALCRAQRWTRPLTQTTRQLILVSPCGDAENHPPHPLWDEVVARLREREQSALLSGTRLRGCDVPQPQRSARPLPRPQRAFTVVKDLVQPSKHWSPSSLATLLGCSLKWTLDYVARLEGPSALPDGSVLYGRVAHEILAAVFKEKPKTPEKAKALAIERFDDLAPHLAATLYLPGADRALADVRQVCAAAAADLCGILRSSKLEVVDVESDLTRPALGSELRGRADLVLGPKPAVLDLKWGSAKWHRIALENDTAHQLAAYSLLVSDSDEPSVPIGYYVLTSRALLTTDDQVFTGGEHIKASPPKRTWAALESAFNNCWTGDNTGGGSLQAQANPAEGLPVIDEDAIDEHGILRLRPPCGFCSYQLLCGKAFLKEEL